jgi:hypothetical protein
MQTNHTNTTLLNLSFQPRTALTSRGFVRTFRSVSARCARDDERGLDSHIRNESSRFWGSPRVPFDRRREADGPDPNSPHRRGGRFRRIERSSGLARRTERQVPFRRGAFIDRRWNPSRNRAGDVSGRGVPGVPSFLTPVRPLLVIPPPLRFRWNRNDAHFSNRGKTPVPRREVSRR